MSQNAATTCSYTYTVKRGDSFYLIARRLGVPLRDLINANADIHPARLMVGDQLVIPCCDAVNHEATETPQPDAPGDTSGGQTDGDASGGQTDGDTSGGQTPDLNCPENRRATVQEGQTAADIQLAYDKSLHTLEIANPGVDLENLQAGQVLCVPDINLPCALPSSVTLQEGETLESVAVRFNLPVATLLRANPCLAPDDFMAGVIVKLPQ